MTDYQFSDSVKALFSHAKKPYLIDVPSLKYLAFNGSGHPNDEDFQEACNALFTISYILKFKIARSEVNIDYKVQPLEITWHLKKSEPVTKFTWEAMILQPDFITAEMCEKAIIKASDAGKSGQFNRLYMYESSQEKAVQAFHRGDYKKMNETLTLMNGIAENAGYSHSGVTHDIYLNDSRKTKTENLQTIMRLIVKK